MRVVTEVAAVDKAFDYLVPDGVEIGIGDRVRVDLHGRSVRGWVTDINLPDEGRELKVLKKRAGFGPPPSFFEIARWASDHYVAPLSRALAAASADRNIVTLPHSSPKGSGCRTRTLRPRGVGDGADNRSHRPRAIGVCRLSAA